MSQSIKNDISNFPKELLLILALLRNDRDHSIKQEISGLAQDIDWQKFLHLSIHHRVYPLIYSKLKKGDYTCIPPEVIASLQQAYENNTYNMMKLTMEMTQVCKLLDDHGIRAIVLKGPVLAQLLYSDLSLRTSKDLDILVSFNHVQKVEQLLIKRGYYLTDTLLRIVNDWKWKNRHLTYVNQQNGTVLELHWSINNEMGQSTPGFDVLWKRRHIYKMGSIDVNYLNPEDLFVYLISHGAHHAWFRLRWLVDIKQLLNSELNWKRIIFLMKKYKSLRLLTQAMILGSRLLNIPIREEINALLNDYFVQNITDQAIFFICNDYELHSENRPENVEEVYHNYLSSIKTNKTIFQRLVLVLIRLYPSSMDAKLLPLPKSIWLLYFPLRPFLWGVRKILNFR